MGKEAGSMAANQDGDALEPVKCYKLDAAFLGRLWTCVKIIFPGWCSKSFMLLVLLALISLGQQVVVYNVGILPSQFMQVLGDKDSTALRPLLMNATCLIFGIAFYNSLIKFISGYLYVIWRGCISDYLHKKYMHKSTFYHVNVLLQNSIDNVDQRITQDADRFCSQLSDMLPKLVVSPFTIIYYSVKCFQANGYIGPLTIYGYFIVGTIANRLIMAPIVNLVVQQEKLEGDFRYKHMEVRSFSESIAFLFSGKVEFKKLSKFLNDLVSVQTKVVHREFLLNFITNLFDYIGSILSYIVISIPIFSGLYDNLKPQQLSALISKNAFVSIYLISCFSTLVDLSAKFTDLFGYAHRIGELVESLKLCNASCDRKEQNFIGCHIESEPIFALSGVTACTPSSTKPFLKDIDMVFAIGENVLITGNTGSGKSSVLRLLANLWSPELGTVQSTLSFHPTSILFLPQKPYLTTGSLLEQVIYPELLESLDHRRLDYVFKAAASALSKVGLDYLISRVGGISAEPVWKWSSRLSPGEVQRLSFARLFYHKPRVAVLDEVTSALGSSEEDCFYTYCSQLDITVISVGHHESLRQYHGALLKLNGDGSWNFVRDGTL